jgi:hypothetical protein
MGEITKASVPSDQKLQFGNGYAEMRGNDLFIAVGGQCLAKPLAEWMDCGWNSGDHSSSAPMQDAVIQDLLQKNQDLKRQCDDLREIALMTARKLR